MVVVRERVVAVPTAVVEVVVLAVEARGDVAPVDRVAVEREADDRRVREPVVVRERVEAEPVWKSNLQPDFNVSVCDSFDARSSAVLRELDESNRFVQKSAESTSI